MKTEKVKSYSAIAKLAREYLKGKMSDQLGSYDFQKFQKSLKVDFNCSLEFSLEFFYPHDQLR
jgi:hypothetical protein